MVVRMRPALFYGLLLLAAVPVFIADYYTPLGVSIWILYLVPLVLTLLGPYPDAPIAAALLITALVGLTSYTDERVMVGVAVTNRVVGTVVVWAIAWLTRRLLITRNGLEHEARVRGAHAELLRVIQGDLGPRDLAAAVLRAVSGTLEAHAGAVYLAEDGAGFRLAASLGADASALPSEIRRGDGLLGEALGGSGLVVIADVRPEAFRMSTALTSGAPRHLALMPLVADQDPYGVMEVALSQPPDAFAREVLERAAASAAVALRTATFRHRVRALLQETQHQRDELQAQQEELRVANEELEEQSRALKASQSRLQEQQAELEASNAQLEAQTQELELQQEALAETAARAEQASRYKSEFLANMSHELRTPLNSILILARLLADNRGGQLTEEQVRYAGTIHGSGSHLLTLINDILDLARIEAGRADVRVESVNLAEFVAGLRETFEPLCRDRDLLFAAELAPGLPETIDTDPVKLRQVAVNLLSNACKFTSAGQVVLRLEPRGADAVALYVEDTGPGIPRDKFGVIFEAFCQADGSTQRRFGGTGLGLTISRELARLLGGDLSVESEVGKGSRFTLVLPARFPDLRPGEPSTGPHPAAEPSAPPPSTRRGVPVAPLPTPPPGDTTRGERRLLIVEDDEAFAGILCDLGRELEFECLVAGTVAEGLRLAQEQQPTGILLDVSLPDGSGLALLDRLKRTSGTRHIPVHMVSVDDHSQTAMALGAIGFAVKPADRDTLVDSVRRIEAETQRQLRRLLIVEDDASLRESLAALLQLDDVELEAVGTAREALDRLAAATFDCVVLDLNLPDATGFDVLDAMSASHEHGFPPVIIYTGRALSTDEEARLRRYSRSVIVKGARSPERLLDEVTLFLHRVEAALPTASQRMLRVARERDGIFEGKRILLAEDDVRNIFALSAVLEPRGATVEIARNGREAVDMVSANRPDLVLMDVMMPEMDGLAAIRALRANPAHRNLPIIALTAKARPDDRQQCLAAGADDYMAKPIDVDQLVSLCRVWMAR